jgi:hypothetical protein
MMSACFCLADAGVAGKHSCRAKQQQVRGLAPDTRREGEERLVIMLKLMSILMMESHEHAAYHDQHLISNTGTSPTSSSNAAIMSCFWHLYRYIFARMHAL